MLLTDYLFNESKKIWDEYLKHPFIVEMGKGTLDKEKFRNYLVQDYLYLLDYAKVYAMGLIKSDDVNHMKFFKDSVNGIMEDESATHIAYLKELGEDIKTLQRHKLKLENENYTNFMKSVALTGDIQDLIIAVLPCAWSYYYIAKEMKEIYKDNLENNYYAAWIDSYSCEEYRMCAKENIDLANELCVNIDDNKKEKLKEIFIKGSLYEMEFWQMAYKEIK
ncbi:Aminopyrimidine aminohydrolase [Terrisporobacter petrolearius]|uniref:Aminopyrimidine aminohydrolase n=1 Tax=Terrisporobacter hibernicus TaxID=2813371 RepID=A0AAX2ZFD1_9FIRM|nr:thiaminase II [Terrisporobacter hibernicus]UEL47440.1 thiaminase II [Terrisporobacter hibernicus]SFJ15152.1 thiaminase (transcriptional activator TenA) [Terrisporobacter glycolicus]